ncbi:unnamed protein product [Ostreobium quekettii]|uniref:CBS domain-containing protein n=1 Tax=Ostreobium quekettii TaxID=121088 RepID=A0A8S1IMX4_9CHLO|nr:unnamed protein product [Ostreobium quekettii]|eukprot:evm.model.scf_729.3 EVM.evm.TU.scf_729.3   scf_729:44933-50619(+)
MDARAIPLGAGAPVRAQRAPQGSEAAREAPRAGGMRKQRRAASLRCGVAGVAQFAETVAEATEPGEVPHMYETVGDVMTTTVISVTRNTPVTEALDLIAKHRITGMPVVDADNVVVGVVSDYDLLALDLPSENQGMFPSLDMSWQTFREIQTLLSKIEGQIVEDVMTKDPMSVRPNTSLDMAARILLESKIRRLPVVDRDGKLIGLLSRRNIVVAALAERKRNAAVAFGGAVGRLA